MPAKITTSICIEKKFLAEIDKQRGLVPRSRFIINELEKNISDQSAIRMKNTGSEMESEKHRTREILKRPER